MIRLIPSVLLLAALALPAEQGQLDASPALFAVMAALDAAGFDAQRESPASHPLREMVRREVLKKNPPVLAELKRFYQAHSLKDLTAEFSQYVSFALSVDGPPHFKYRFQPQQLPPDVTPLDGFEKLLVRFYQEADIEPLWQKAQPAIEEAIARYHEPVTRAVVEVGGYLRVPGGTGYLGRRFQIYLDLLGPPNHVQTRSYADDYFVVVTPSAEPQTEEIRHAYLHYLLDPLATRHSDELGKKKALGDYALGSPILENHYKEDFLLLATESLIKAIEARLTPGAPAKKQVLVDQALGQGFILAPYFADALPVYEQQEQAMRLYFVELIKGIDLKKEEQRLENVRFASERPVRKVKVVPAERKVELAGPDKTLEEAEQHYSRRDLDQARAVWLRLLQETSEKPLHAKAYYGLARVATLQNNPELAEKLFQKTLELEPDAPTRAWAHVYLGRLADLAGDRQQATQQYQAVLAVPGASDAARQAAEKGLAQAFPRENQRK